MSLLRRNSPKIKLDKSCKVLVNILRDLDNYGRKLWAIRLTAVSIITARDKRAIIRVASNSSIIAKQIAKKAEVATNVRNCELLGRNYKVLKNCEDLKRRKLQQKSWLKQEP